MAQRSIHDPVTAAAAGIPRRTFLYGSLAASLVGLTACSNVGPTGPTTSGAPAATTGAAPSGATTGGAPTGTVTIIQGVDPTTLDPMMQRETTTENVLIHLYDTLLVRDAEDSTQFQGNLATEWNLKDPTTLEVKLKTDAKFSDGSTMTADDVKYSFDYLLGTGKFTKPSIAAYQYGTIKDVTVVDPATVTITTKAVDALLLGRLANLFVIKGGSVDAAPDALASAPVGTGPYSLVKWDRNSQVVLKAREDYHRGVPSIAEVVIKTVAEASSRLAALKAGSADLITNVPADNVAEIESSDTAVIKEVPSARIASVWLDTLKDGPLKDKRVRVALNHAIDVDKIIETVMSGRGKRVATFVPEYFQGYDASVKPISFDPARAKALLQEAGQGNGFEIEIMVPEGRYPFATDVAQAMVPFLADVGVTLKVKIVEFGVFAKATQARTIGDGFFGAWGNAFFNPLDELVVAVQSGDKGFSWYNNPTVDNLIEEASQQTDAAEQTATMTKIQNELLADPPFIFLFAYVDTYGVSKRLDFTPRSDESLPMFDAKVTG